MFIQPMGNIGTINPTVAGTGITPAPSPFKDVFQNAIKDVIETDNQVNIDTQMLATGQSDDLHMLGIDITKAQLSISMLVQLRNKAMDAYNEVMRINL